jgi:hypothetical protein
VFCRLAEPNRICYWESDTREAFGRHEGKFLSGEIASVQVTARGTSARIASAIVWAVNFTLSRRPREYS